MYANVMLIWEPFLFAFVWGVIYPGTFNSLVRVYALLLDNGISQPLCSSYVFQGVDSEEGGHHCSLGEGEKVAGLNLSALEHMEDWFFLAIVALK